MRKLFLVMLALAMTPVLATAGGGTGYYDWQWSFSDTDPSMNTSPALAPGVTPVYLWYTGCNTADPQPGMAAAEMDANMSGDFSIIAAFSPQNGFLNAGGSNEKLLLIVGGCASGPVVAGNFQAFVSGAGEGTVGLRESTDNNWAVVVDCTDQDGWYWPEFVRFQGCGTTGAALPIQDHGAGCTTVSVDPESWGGVKALYR